MFIHFVQSVFSLVIPTRFVLGEWRVRFLKCDVALIVQDGYCLRIAHHSQHVQSLGTSHCNNHILSPPPRQRKDGMPSCQAWLKVGEKRRVAHSGNLHWCSSHSRFVSGDLGM